MTDLIRRHPLIAFLTMAYLGSWAGWSPWWLSESGLGLPYELPVSAIAGVNQLGLFAGPFAAALIVTRVVEGREGVRRLLRRLVRWRAHPGLHALALVAIPVAAGAGYLLVRAPAGDPGLIAPLAITYATYLLGGPIQEEPGWRGFALPRLRRRLSPIAAALVLGVIHCFWHAPLFLTREWDTARGDAGQLVAYLVLTVSLSVVLSWLASGSRGSLMLAVLGHNGVNWALFAAGALTGSAVTSTWPAALGLAALALAAIALTRGRLGDTDVRPGSGPAVEPLTSARSPAHGRAAPTAE
ncbi:CPBP family intramembrane metalloprotease [Nonomuraea sp. NBC_01738]|uniref:CPBP family intramembrane glutamic endopeptidase n=1 Tax=Nonomuraea sp. NBC_01738 TaxID=2976003 RepID=UPI002E120E48|nr:CPBP family intramembrane metalloprotease [Nonomuraea sp. NBC_01738]